MRKPTEQEKQEVKKWIDCIHQAVKQVKKGRNNNKIKQ